MRFFLHFLSFEIVINFKLLNFNSLIKNHEWLVIFLFNVLAMKIWEAVLDSKSWKILWVYELLGEKSVACSCYYRKYYRNAFMGSVNERKMAKKISPKWHVEKGKTWLLLISSWPNFCWLCSKTRIMKEIKGTWGKRYLPSSLTFMYHQFVFVITKWSTIFIKIKYSICKAPEESYTKTKLF